MSKKILAKSGVLDSNTIHDYALTDKAITELKEKIVGAKVFYNGEWVGDVECVIGNEISIYLFDTFVASVLDNTISKVDFTGQLLKDTITGISFISRIDIEDL